LDLPRTDWQAIKIHPKIVRTVAAITSGIFVGPEICRDEVWINTIIDYTRDIVSAITLLKYWPACLRSISKFFMPEIWRVRHHNNTARRMVSEALQRPSHEKHIDAVHGVLAMVPQNRKTDYRFQGKAQLGIAAAGLHTTVRMLYHVFFDLATYPEYIPLLRQEIKSVLGESCDGYTVENFNLLKKMDSFMKESMRLQGGGLSKRHPFSFNTYDAGKTNDC
jgi:hypothetical protein